MIDGLVVIGGGLSGASDLFLPVLVNELNSHYINEDGSKFRRLVQNVYNVEDENELNKFLSGNKKEINILDTDKKITYDSDSRLGVGILKSVQVK